jgi:hypothetical protein
MVSLTVVWIPPCPANRVGCVHRERVWHQKFWRADKVSSRAFVFTVVCVRTLTNATSFQRRPRQRCLLPSLPQTTNFHIPPYTSTLSTTHSFQNTYRSFTISASKSDDRQTQRLLQESEMATLTQRSSADSMQRSGKTPQRSVEPTWSNPYRPITTMSV